MAEHVFYCGLSSDQVRRFEKNGQRLTLNGKDANIDLQIDDIRTRYRRDLPLALIDLIEIAAYVFAADNATPRGGPKRKNMGAAWRRNFHLVIGVRQLETWSRADVRTALQDALNFISDDVWRLEFVINSNPAPNDEYLKFKPEIDNPTAPRNIVLFSGGLDSLSGAVRELVEERQTVVLVSHRAAPIIMNRQDRLVEMLKSRFGNRVFHVPVRIQMKKNLMTREHSQRTRSFLFSSLAAIVAHLEETSNIRFYENGVMSINLPPAMHYVGSRASRTTHPNSLVLLQEAICRASGTRFEIDNPFIWLTKGEVLGELADKKAGKLIPLTISCTRTRELDAMHSHCGKCAQCVHRRFAVISRHLESMDPAESYASEPLNGIQKDAFKNATSVDIIRTSLEMSHATDLEFLGSYGGHISLLSSAFPGMTNEEVARRSIGLFHRFGNEIYQVLSSTTGSEAQQPLVSGDVEATSKSSADKVKGQREQMPNENARLKARLRAPSECSGPVVSTGRGVILIIDELRSELDIDGLGLEEKGQRIYAIVSLLAEQRQRDAADGVSPRDYPAVRLDDLAKKMNLENDGPLRSAISRFLKKTKTIHADLNPGLPALDDVIENVRGQGYRINPSVHIHRRRK